MASGAALKLERAVFEYERSLLVGVALDTSRISANCQLGLFLFEPAVRIVAIAALHRAFENFMVKGLAELSFRFVVAGHAKLRLVCGKHSFRRLAWVLCGCVADDRHRTRPEVAR